MTSHLSVNGFWRDARMLSVLLVWAACATSPLIYLNGVIPLRHAAPAALQVVDDEVLYTGSIVMVPRSGDECRRLTFDNRTGSMWEGGSIDCDDFAKMDKTRGQGAISYVRMQAIHDTFHR
jgi:hypothetical protein